MKTLYTFLLSVMISSLTLQAQNSSTKKADKHFDRLEYVDAIEDYEELIRDGKANAYVYKQLAISNYKIYKTEEAERNYKTYLGMTESPSAEDYLGYAQTLIANKRLDKFKEAMRKFSELAPQDARAIAFKKNPNYVSKLLFAEPKFDVKRLELNSEFQDFGAYEYDGKLFFVSARNKSRRTYGWNDQPTLDIFVASNVGGTFKNEVELEGEVNSKFHEGTVAITNDAQTLYFTRNDYTDGNYEKDSTGIGRLKIYKASLRDGQWADIQELPINSSNYSTGSPALSPDNKTLYFSSDRPGGFGESDIYKVAINNDGSFGEPQNLGKEINTPGRESFPFVDQDQRLYFSSDGHLGLGGLDVFYANLNDSGNYVKPRNIGKPVNSSADDFSFTYMVAMKSGYVSSNRGKNSLDDDIYQANLIEPLDQTMVIVNLVNSETQEPIEAAEVIVYEDNGDEITKLKTDKAGKASTILLMDLEYDFQANKDKFESASKRITAEGEQMVVTIPMVPVKDLIEDRSVTLKNIFFEFDKATIRPEAALGLDRIVEVLKEYSDVVIRIESHTDRRGPAAYNKRLSEKRAQSTVDYIISQGIDASRVSGVGKGEEEPINDCANGCTEEEHEENRRSEFIIVE